MNILFSSCGRRVELIRFFKSAKEIISNGHIIGIDANPLAPALQVVDKAYLAPRIAEIDYLPFIRDLCEKEKVDILIPLIDTELPIYAKEIDDFKAIGVRILVSPESVIEICFDKLKTTRYFKRIKLPHLVTYDANDHGWKQKVEFPAIIKPKRGSSSKDVYIVKSEEEVDIFRKRIDNPILQEMAKGMEITLDCLSDLSGCPVRIFARERLETRAGESSKGRTFKDRDLFDLAERLLNELRAIGPTTIQCFRTESGYRFTEINPRFGGGYPLSHHAGADYPNLILRMCKGEIIGKDIGNYEEDIYFCRYDEAFYLKNVKNGKSFIRINDYD